MCIILHTGNIILYLIIKIMVTNNICIIFIIPFNKYIIIKII